MMKTDRLFELLDQALHAAECNCSVTTRAYLTMAKAESFSLIDAIHPGAGRDKVRRAALYISDLVDRHVRSGRLRRAADTAFEFWLGFDDGYHQRTFPQRAAAGYRRGYRFGRTDA